MSTHPYELELIKALHTLRTPWLDSFFIKCNFLDTVYFFMILLPLVWFFGNRKTALKIGGIFALSWVMNKSLKYTFGLPRPFNLDPSLRILTTLSPGFPSGAAQTAALMCGIILNEWESAWRWIVGPFFAAVLCFSRVYLGLHFPTDILGGLLVGSVLFWIYKKL